VVTIDGEDVLQVELLSSLSAGDGRAIPAGIFVPIASRLTNFGIERDREY